MGGKTIVVGAPFRDSEPGTDSGAAYVFALDGATWKFQAQLTPGKLKKNFNFGFGVATTGSIVIVGAPGHDDPARGSGAAYSFVRTDGVWTETATVVPEDGAKDIHFGSAISMSENAVAVASHSGPFLNHDGKPNGDGHAAYIYNSIEDFGTPPFAVDPSGLKVTTLAHTTSKSKCYSRYRTRNELRYYKPPVLVTDGLRISIRSSRRRFCKTFPIRLTRRHGFRTG